MASPDCLTLLESGAAPALPGSYALHLSLAQPVHLQIGRLGVFDFPPGDYLYLGSARGPGGLRSRLMHHARIADKPHWHIDYLRAVARLEGFWISTDPAGLECAWSQALQRLPGSVVPVKGFGAGDCTGGCPAHLLAFPGGLDRAAIETALEGSRLESRAVSNGFAKTNKIKVVFFAYLLSIRYGSFLRLFLILTEFMVARIRRIYGAAGG